MSALDAALAAIMIAHAVDLSRLSAHEQVKVLDLLKQLETDLTKLLAVNVLSEMGKRDTASVLREITALVQEVYTEAALTTQATVTELAPLSADMTAQAMEQVLNISIGPGSKPSAGYLDALARDLLIQGSPMGDWFSKQAGDIQFRIAAELRKGMAAGETNQQIISRIIGKNGEPGVMDIARKNAAALVQTATSTVANQAKLAMYRKNADITNGIQWNSTLDGHTCIECANLDGQKWDLEGAALPGTTMPYQEAPAHVNCRCVMLSVLKPMSEVSGGTLPDLPKNGSRASTDGPVPATTTFADWFASRTPEQQAEQFGVGKAALYRAGKINLRDMLDQSGNPLTLTELKAKYR